MFRSHAPNPLLTLIRLLLRPLGQGRRSEPHKAAPDRTEDKPENLPQNPVPSVPPKGICEGDSNKIPHKISPTGIALIKRFEGCARLRPDGLVEAYPDPATGGDPWTIGWGATGRGLDGQTPIGPGTIWTQAECDARLRHDLLRYAADVSRALGAAATSQGQFDAMVSFHYNTGAIARATLTNKHIAGDHDGALREFARWNKAGGRVLRGLIRRRAEEAKLYRG